MYTGSTFVLYRIAGHVATSTHRVERRDPLGCFATRYSTGSLMKRMTVSEVSRVSQEHRTPSMYTVMSGRGK